MSLTNNEIENLALIKDRVEALFIGYAPILTFEVDDLNDENRLTAEVTFNSDISVRLSFNLSEALLQIDEDNMADVTEGEIWRFVALDLLGCMMRNINAKRV